MSQPDELDQYAHLTITHPKQHVAFWLFMLCILGVLYVFAVDIPNALRRFVYDYYGVEEQNGLQEPGN